MIGHQNTTSPIQPHDTLAPIDPLTDSMENLVDIGAHTSPDHIDGQHIFIHSENKDVNHLGLKTVVNPASTIHSTQDQIPASTSGTTNESSPARDYLRMKQDIVLARRKYCRSSLRPTIQHSLSVSCTC